MISVLKWKLFFLKLCFNRIIRVQKYLISIAYRSVVYMFLPFYSFSHIYNYTRAYIRLSIYVLISFFYRSVQCFALIVYALAYRSTKNTT